MMHLVSLKPLLIATSLSAVFLLSGCDQANTENATANGASASNSETNASKTNKPFISVAEKKANFFAFLHPLIKQANNEVLEQRSTLLSLEQNLTQLTDKQLETLAELAKSYKVDKKLSPAQQIELLKVKIHTIPASLVLAQAANESAWGTSRFATEGNNFFGQWCFRKGCGLVPEGRNDGAKHEVARFKTPLGSVKSYIRNLNSFPPYELLRTLRQQSLDKNQPVSGINLANGLIDYSQRREEYVKEIQSMIRFNKLWRFNSEPNATTAAAAKMPHKNSSVDKGVQDDTLDNAPASAQDTTQES